MNRVVNVARLYAVNRWTTLYTPLLILAGCFALGIGIQLAVIAGAPEAANQPSINASIISIFCYLLSIAIVAGSRMFPFSFSMGLTRRTFFLGSALAGIVSVIALAALMTAGAWAEGRTDNWGVSLGFFNPLWMVDGGLGGLFAFYLGLGLFMIAIGFLCCIVFKRWGLTGVMVLLTSIAVVVAAGLIAMILTESIPAVLGWLGEQTLWTLAAYLGGLGLLAGLGSYGVIRKAIP